MTPGLKVGPSPAIALLLLGGAVTAAEGDERAPAARVAPGMNLRRDPRRRVR
jgi:hypothetical protein